MTAIAEPLAFDFDAYHASHALAAVAALDAADRTGLWTALEAGPVTVGDLARNTGTDVRGVKVVLRVMGALGMLQRDPAGRYLARHGREGYRSARDRMGRLADALVEPRGDRPAPYEQVVELLAEHVGGPAVAGLPAAFHEARRILDVGAGAAPYTRPMARADGAVELTLVDRRPVLDEALRLANADGTAAQLRLVPGDLLEVPYPDDQDLVVIANVVHLFDDDRCAVLLERAASALRPGGHLAIIEPLPNPTLDGPLDVALYAVGLYLRSPEGGVRTFATYADWLARIGLSRIERHDLGHAHLGCVIGRSSR